MVSVCSRQSRLSFATCIVIRFRGKREREKKKEREKRRAGERERKTCFNCDINV